jgi:pyruvate dehydrogenase (quinone)
MAAFMASAYAKFSGELGVCIATSGPGASHLVTGLYDARLDHMPVLAITGQQARTAIGGHYQQEVDLPSLLKDVAGAFVEQASAPAQVRHLVDRAIRTALGERRVTAIVLPNDLQEAPYQEPPRKHGTVHSGVGFAKPKRCRARPICAAPPTCSTSARESRSWLAQARFAPPTR